MSLADQAPAAPSQLLMGADTEKVRRLIRAVGWTLIAAQLAGLIAWSTYAYSHGALSWDFAAYYQPWWSIAHGHLDPAATVMPGGYPFWKNDGEFIIWLLAPLYWLLPNHQLGLWWLQDLALAGISVVCFRWIGELLPWDQSKPLAANMGPAVGWLLTPLLLVLNPWIYWSTTFAIQMEPFGVLFAMLALRALMSRRRSVWVWCLLGALCGSASIVFIVSVGLAGLVTRAWHLYRARRNGAVTDRRAFAAELTAPALIILGGVVWLGVLGALHATQSFSNPAISVHRDLAYLNGPHSRGGLLLLRTAANAVSHPGAVINVIGSHTLNLWANAGPAGLVGLASVPGFFMSVPTLLENSILKGQDFSYPGFPSLIVYTSVAIGSALVAARLVQRRRSWGLALTALLVVNAIAWCVVWLPKTGSQYVSIDGSAAHALSRAAAQIPSSAEVIASQGFVGRFAARRDVRVFGGPSSNVAGPETFPIDASDVWFVLSPSQGIEVPSTSASDRAIGSVARLPGVKLVDSADGLWVFRWRPPSATHTVSLGPPRAVLPAWTTAGTSARAVLAGSPNRWRLTSNGASGYVVSGDIWRLNPGRYNARLSLSSTAPANVEIWSDASSGDVLLARRRVRSKHSRELTVPFAVKQPAAAPNSTGPAPFAYEPVPPPRGATVEVRVWTPGSGSTTVKTVDVQPSSN